MTELVVVSAADDAALAGEVRRLIAFIDRVPDVSLIDVAYTCSLTHGPSALSIIAGDTAALRSRLASALSRLESAAQRIRDKSGTYYFRDHLIGEGKGRLAFVFPGVASFYPDMLRDLAIGYAPCRDAFDELEEAMKDNVDFTPSSFIFPPAPYYRHDADIFKSGAYAQALVSTYSACSALSRLLVAAGLRPDGIVGFAGGELAAMMRSGAAGEKPSRPDRVSIIRDIFSIVDKAVNHGGFPKVAMLGVLMRHAGEIDGVAEGFPSDKVLLSVDYSPRQRTYAVAADFEEKFREALAPLGARVMKLEFDRPFNTPMCEALVPAIRKFAATWMKNDPKCEVYSCATGEIVPARLKAAREDTAGRWARPIRFVDTIRRMHADGYRVFVEVGPRGLATAAIEDTMSGLDFAAIPTNSIHRVGRLQLQYAIGQLVALGAEMDLSQDFVMRRARRLDFDSAISLEVRRNSERRLSREFPKLTLLSTSTLLQGTRIVGEPSRRGAKAAQRAAAIAQRARRQRQFDFGATNPLVSDEEPVESTPGVSIELSKVFKFSEMPFLGDYALGTSQMSYSDPNLRGLVLLTIPVGVEIMGETVGRLLPNLTLQRVEDFSCRRMVSFERGELKLVVRAERIACSNAGEVAVKALLREDRPGGAFTWPVMEGTFFLAEKLPEPVSASVDPLSKPRSVHWSGRDIYPARICLGSRLRGIDFVEAWSETGMDYEVVVPPLAGNVVFTRFPVWVANPLLYEIVVSGFSLWRSHEKFSGAFSLPFHMRRIDFWRAPLQEGARLKCYLRLTGVTPRSHLCDIVITDGNGTQLARVSGWEELTDRVPVEYRNLVLQPAMSYLTESLGRETLGNPSTDISSAFVTDVPYAFFERNEELWLRVVSRIVLNSTERRNFADMTGSASRRTEWLFGRIAAKEAVRRYLKDFYQARWSDADVQIWADDSGKPHALGDWEEFLTTKLDIAIAHTAQFVVAIAAANARVGVDVEAIARDLSKEFATGVFTPDELDLAATAVSSHQALIRFWCAKEAVSKALGTGIRYSPREMVVSGYQADAGLVTVRLEGAWLDAFKVFKGRDIPVTVRTVREHALASCFIPASLFEE